MAETAEDRFCVEAAAEWKKNVVVALRSYEEGLEECVDVLPTEVCRDGLGAEPYLDSLRREVTTVPAMLPSCRALKRALQEILAAIDHVAKRVEDADTFATQSGPDN